MSITGKYVFASNDNYEGFLAAVGVPAHVIPKLEVGKPQMEVTQEGDQMTMKSVNGDRRFTNTITFGQDSKVTLPSGNEYTLNVTLSGSTLTGTFKMGDHEGPTSFEFTDAGFTKTVTCGGQTAKLVYTRQ